MGQRQQAKGQWIQTKVFRWWRTLCTLRACRPNTRAAPPVGLNPPGAAPFRKVQIAMQLITPEFIGNSPAVLELKEEIARVASSDAKVLIVGESGAGKEVVARTVHALSRRADRPFVPVNSAGLPETLLESELFGHIKGSFTGAYRDKPGKLELADTGTVFLDEIGDMTLRMQGILLRFLETGELQRVGTDRVETSVNVRVVSATNRNLEDLIAKGLFREDLFYRLNVVHLTVPPLRERKGDVPLLVEQFLKRFVGLNGNTVRGVSPEAMQALTNYDWPGNIRQLQNVIQRILVTGHTEVVGLDELPSELRTARVATRPVKERRRTVADELYTRVVEQRESFWTAVYPRYMNREITKVDVRNLVGKGLDEARGNYKIVARLFNMESRDYKKFLNFLRKHECQVPFRDYR
jgi:transcriptional regulator with PAS, ATPase and Fis domain